MTCLILIDPAEPYYIFAGDSSIMNYLTLRFSGGEGAAVFPVISKTPRSHRSEVGLLLPAMS